MEKMLAYSQEKGFFEVEDDRFFDPEEPWKEVPGECPWSEANGFSKHVSELDGLCRTLSNDKGSWCEGMFLEIRHREANAKHDWGYRVYLDDGTNFKAILVKTLADLMDLRMKMAPFLLLHMQTFLQAERDALSEQAF
jgi:hypothetical protein